MKIFRFFKISSTNDIAFEKLAAGEPPIFGVSAESQTNGRGRRGHVWVSEKGNLFLSFALDPKDFSVNNLKIFPQCFVLKFVDIVQSEVRIKWPNDIFFNEKKVGGVLLETRFENAQLKYAVLGVGINICSAPNIENWAKYSAGSLPKDVGSLEEVEEKIIQALHDTLFLFRTKNMVNFLQKNWQKYDIFYNRKIVICSNGQRFSGVDIGVNADGALILSGKNSELNYFNSGESEIIID